MLALILMYFLATNAQAELNAKYDAELAEVSRKLSEEGLPKSNIETWYPLAPYEKLNQNSVSEYRHMHAMVVAAFYSTRKDKQELALNWLQKYKCENWVACRDLDDFLHSALKAKKSAMTSKNRTAVKSLSKSIKEQLKNSEKKKPKQQGLCGLEANRKDWLELEYQILCPTQDLGTDTGFAKGSPDENRLKKQLEYDSHQVLLSSSYLISVSHTGSKHCLEPWKTKISCGGHAEVEFNYQCNIKDAKERSVTCELIAK